MIGPPPLGPTGPTGYAAYQGIGCTGEQESIKADAFGGCVGSVAALSSVSCATLTSCEAVGTVGSSQVPFGPLDEGSNGTSWSIQPTSSPVAVGVSCALKTACMAVGYEFSSASDSDIPTAQVWNGSTWTSRPPPSPAGAIDTVLSYVQCATGSTCMAVGEYETGGYEQPLIEFWNGSVWTIEPASLPTGASGGWLYGVSCPSTATCTAVGTYYTSAGGPFEQSALAESWDGSSWSLQPTPAPASTTSSSLNAVWCFSKTSCNAVGSNATDSGEETLAESWNGTSWSIQTTPNPSGSTHSSLANLSCDPGSSNGAPCKAVGSSEDETLIESWDGTKWGLDETPVISNADGDSFSIENSLNDVSCTSSKACTAVGSYLDNSIGAWLALAERWNGTSWTVQPTPDPPVVEADSTTDVAGTSATLNGIVWPNRATVTSCYFEYGTSYPLTSTVPCAQAIGAGTSPVSVTAGLSGLTPNTTYYVALAATNMGGTATEDFSSPFTTGAPLPPTPPSPPSPSPPPQPSACPGTQPAICTVTPASGPLLGGAHVTVTGAGFSPGDELCFYLFQDATQGECSSQTTVVSSTEITAVTPSENYPTGGIGQYYVGIQRYRGGLSLEDFVSSVQYIFFPPPPPLSPPPNSCEVFSFGPNACWRVGLGAAGSWFTSEISSAFAPGRDPDFITLELSAGKGYSVGPTGSLTAVVTCSGDLFVEPAGGINFGGGGLPTSADLAGLNIGAVLGAGFVGTPGNPEGSLTWHQVDGFAHEFTADISVGAPFVGGMTFILSFTAPGPHTGIEYWEGAAAQVAATLGYGFFVTGPDRNESSTQHCGDILTTPTWRALTHTSSSGEVVATQSNSVALALPCTAAGGCTGTATLSAGGGAAAASTRARSRQSGVVLGRAKYSTSGPGFGKIMIALRRRGRRLLKDAHGVLPATLVVEETASGKKSRRVEALTIVVRPRTTHVRQSALRWLEQSGPRGHNGPVGTSLSFILNESAEIKLKFRRHGGLPPSTVSEWSLAGHRGANIIHFRGFIGRADKLPSGEYTVSLSATNAAGEQSASRSLRFRILG